MAKGKYYYVILRHLKRSTKVYRHFAFSTLKASLKGELCGFNHRNTSANIPNISPKMTIIRQNKSGDLCGRIIWVSVGWAGSRRAWNAGWTLGFLCKPVYFHLSPVQRLNWVQRSCTRIEKTSTPSLPQFDVLAIFVSEHHPVPQLLGHSCK